MRMLNAKRGIKSTYFRKNTIIWATLVSFRV